MAPSMSQLYTHDLSTTQKMETEQHCTFELHQSCLQQVVEMEVGMGIEKRWDPSSPEYIETVGYLST